MCSAAGLRDERERRVRSWRRYLVEPAARPDSAQRSLAAAVIGNRFVVTVGGEGPVKTFEQAEAFDVTRLRWLRLPPLPTPRHGLGVVAVGRVLYAIAGEPQPGLTVAKANEALDLARLGR